MTCHSCQSICKKSGKHRNGLQRFKCSQCKRSFTEEHQRPLDEMRLPFEKALLVLQMLVEGVSIRSTERITGVEKKTILSLLVLAGERCERLMEKKLRNVKVSDIQADEVWAYVGMKEKTKKRKGKDADTLGDAYTFVAFERDSKLILAWHLGRRTERDTLLFTEKVFAAVDGTDNRIQVTTDGFPAYPDAIAYSFRNARRLRPTGKNLRGCGGRRRAAVLSGEGDRSHTHARLWQPRPRKDLHVSRRAAESKHQNGDAEIYATDERLL